MTFHNEPNHFLTENLMHGGDWRAFELAVCRLLSHCGWTNVQYVGQPGDKGADILAVGLEPTTKNSTSFLFQAKSVTSSSHVGKAAIDEAIQGQAHYQAKVVVVVSNGEFTKSAYQRRDQLLSQGFNVKLWNGKFLLKLVEKSPELSRDWKPLRQYQSDIVDTITCGYKNGRQKALFIVATGLGKTVVASSIAAHLYKSGLRRVLVLCHATDLAFQLQKTFWTQLPKQIPTRLFMEGEPPIPMEGVNFGLYQTLFSYLGGIDPTAFDLIIVDEAHHAMANAFSTCIEHLKPKLLIGMTATPWRGDGESIESIFGEPVAKMSLIDGMRKGFLAKVDYRLMCDNIDWKEIPNLAKKSLTIRDLNKRLFLPQRDDAVIAKIQEVTTSIHNPRIAVFSSSKKHAGLFAEKLVSAGIPAANLSIDDKIKRRAMLLNFSAGVIKAVTAVDVLNEGIDVPDVNLLVFLRATHSRRIFVQQLGRGLRLAPGKDCVIVLDFVSDIRRIAAVCELDREARAEPKPSEIETVILRGGVVTFSDEKAQKFVNAWINDVASLEDSDDVEKLAFPEIGDMT